MLNQKFKKFLKHILDIDSNINMHLTQFCVFPNYFCQPVVKLIKIHEQIIEDLEKYKIEIKAFLTFFS